MPRIWWIAFASLWLAPSSAFAQDVTEPALKAAFIYNFTKFTEWPADVAPAQQPLVLCVVGDTGVAEALERAVKARVLDGRRISVSFIAPGASQPRCHVLYVSAVTVRQAAQQFAGVRDTPVLTIGDFEESDKVGAVVRFFFAHGHLRFSVDLASARRARLQISSKLLALAIRE